MCFRIRSKAKSKREIIIFCAFLFSDVCEERFNISDRNRLKNRDSTEHRSDFAHLYTRFQFSNFLTFSFQNRHRYVCRGNGFSIKILVRKHLPNVLLRIGWRRVWLAYNLRTHSLSRLNILDEFSRLPWCKNAWRRAFRNTQLAYSGNGEIFIHIDKPFLYLLFKTFVNDTHTGLTAHIISHFFCNSKYIKIKVYRLFPRRFYNVPIPLEDDSSPCSTLRTWPHLQANRKRVSCFIAFFLWNIKSQRGIEPISYLLVFCSTSESFIARDSSFCASNDKAEKRINIWRRAISYLQFSTVLKRVPSPTFTFSFSSGNTIFDFTCGPHWRKKHPDATRPISQTPQIPARIIGIETITLQ